MADSRAGAELRFDDLSLGIDDFDLPISLRAVDPGTGRPGRYLGFNSSFYHSYRLDEVPTDPGAIVGPAAAEIDAVDQQVVDSGRPADLQVARFQTLISLHKQPVIRDGEVIAVLTVSTDLTDLATMASERDMMAFAAHSTNDRLLLYRVVDDEEGSRPELVFANRAATAFIDRLAADTSRLADRARSLLHESLSTALATATGHEVRIDLNDEVCLARDEPLLDAEGAVTGAVRTISDLSPAVVADWTEQLLDIATLDDTAEAVERAFTVGCELLSLPIAVLAELVDDELVIHGRREADGLPNRLVAHSDFTGTLERGGVQLFRDLDRMQASGPIITVLGLKSLAAIPITVDGTKWGLLAFGATERRVARFPSRTKPLLAALGGTLAKMLERDAARDRLVPVELLRRSNRELEEYAYAAAHDLRSPLRAMGSFSQLLMQQLASDPGDVAKLRRYGERIVAGAERMDVLLSSMLEHARATKTTDAGGDATDVGALVAGLVEGFDENLRTLGATITAGPLPRLLLDGGQLERVLHNLIDNALKYRHPDRAPVIVIESATDAETGEVAITVADNGLGIPPEHREQVFGLFKRLTSEGEGTGVGLAMVRRIVEENEGAISVDESPTGGAAFEIRFPANRVDPAS